jgi:hypothetical protein
MAACRASQAAPQASMASIAPASPRVTAPSSTPPFSRADLVVCRNVLIYQRLELQRKVIRHTRPPRPGPRDQGARIISIVRVSVGELAEGGQL